MRKAGRKADKGGGGGRGPRRRERVRARIDGVGWRAGRQRKVGEKRTRRAMERQEYKKCYREGVRKPRNGKAKGTG